MKSTWKRLTLLFLYLLSVSSGVDAGHWQPLCLPQKSCVKTGYKNSFSGREPFVDNTGVWFHTSLQENDEFTVFRVKNLNEPPEVYPDYDTHDAGFINANRSVLTQDGAAVTALGAYWLNRVYPGNSSEVEHVYGGSAGVNSGYFLLAAPERVSDTLLYMHTAGIRGTITVRSIDDGFTWEEIDTDFGFSTTMSYSQGGKILLANPRENGFWLILLGWLNDLPVLVQDPDRKVIWLVESMDGGESWQRVDDGSFPDNTHRIVHDPEDTQTSYALTDQGLYVSPNEGLSWSATTLKERISTLVFVPRNPPLKRVLIVGTETGVLVSQDEGLTWEAMSNGLTKIPHTVVYGHGMLVATSELGYFTCQAVDCAGVAQEKPIPDDQYKIEVTEFYNTNLDHYFITQDRDEVAAIEAGKAGKGWQRTGHVFNAWRLQSTSLAPPGACRFYGSMSPGPNSHFFTISKEECAFLVKRSEEVSPDKPRWNLEYYSVFTAFEPGADGRCREGLVPVYRAYNNGYSKGIDSNHRFVTDRTLLQPLIAEGWVDEGIKMCTPP